MNYHRQKTAVFRTDAGPSIGGGHVMRCLTLAEELSRRGWACAFAVSPEASITVPSLANSNFPIFNPDHSSSVDLLIVDHYGLGARYESQGRDWAKNIMVIDDLADRAHDCDVLLDQTYGRDPADYGAFVPTYCKILCGAAYAVLRPQFTDLRTHSLARRDNTSGIIQRILVSCGMTNPGNITGFILDALQEITSPLHLDIVLGSAAYSLGQVLAQCDFINRAGLHQVNVHIDTPDMAILMVAADFAIGAGGTTSWERCCLGLPSFIIETAKNQSLIAEKLHALGAALYLGPYADVSSTILRQSMLNLMRQPGKVQDMSYAARSVCDGRGTNRLCLDLLQVCSASQGNVYLRLMTMEDCNLVLSWQSEQQSRKYFNNPETPDLHQHIQWMEKILNNPGQLPCIIVKDDFPAGLIRLDRQYNDSKKRTFEVSILIDPQKLNQGVATEALKLIRDVEPNARLIAQIKSENIASIQLFKKAGYKHYSGEIYEST